MGEFLIYKNVLSTVQYKEIEPFDPNPNSYIESMSPLCKDIAERHQKGINGVGNIHVRWRVV